MQIKQGIFLVLLVGIQTFSFGEILRSDSSDSIEPSDQDVIEEKVKDIKIVEEEKTLGHILTGDDDQEHLPTGEILGGWQEGPPNQTESNKKIIEIR